MQKLIEFKDVLLGYGGKPALPKINFTLFENDFLGVVGPNGAGKTTFIKSILGLLSPLKGKIIRHKKLLCGYVPQRESVDEIYPLTVRDIVNMSRFPLNLPFMPLSQKDREAVNKALEMAGISQIADKLFRSLSGGQKQRTLIARALAPNPDILILDEPTNGMDIIAEKKIMDLIVDLKTQKGITVIIVTHLLYLVANKVDKLLLINDRLLYGTPSDVLNSETLSETYGGDVEVIMDSSNQKFVVVK